MLFELKIFLAKWNAALNDLSQKDVDCVFQPKLPACELPNAGDQWTD